MSEVTDQQPDPAQVAEPEGIDWKAEARKWEQRAKENKGAADELAGLRDSQKTAEQRFEERLAEMEKRAADAEAVALRSNVAAKYGISAEDRDLFLTGADESTLTAQAQRLADREEDRKKQGNYAPKEGTSPSPSSGSDDLREFTKKLFSKE